MPGALCEDIPVEDRAQDLFDRFSVEAALQDPFVRLSAQGVYKRSPRRIPVRDLSVQTLYQRSLSKIFVLFTRPVCKIFTSGLLVSFLHKLSKNISRPDLCKGSLNQFSVQIISASSL